MPRLCFVTPNHIATNPRLVKEARAAGAAGYDIRVVFSQYDPELAEADAEILRANPAWTSDVVCWINAGASRALWRSSRVRHALAMRAYRVLPVRALRVRALARVYDELLAAAARTPADLYLAHNLAALPIASAAAERWGTRFTFDAEDFHRGDLMDDRSARRMRPIVEATESEFMPRAAAVTAASDGIADAYAACLGIERPVTVLNVFEQSERDAELPPDACARERHDGERSVYWFSQTIGPHRGLDNAVGALAHLPSDVHLYLRGRWAPGYETVLRGHASTLGVGDRLHAHDTVHAHQLVRLAACHDVGLAAEVPVNESHRICVANKLFTYLLAGIPAAVSDTEGQRNVSRGFPNAVRIYPQNDPRALATAIRELLDDRHAPAAALSAALERYSWDVERERFLGVLARVAGTPESRGAAARHAAHA